MAGYVFISNSTKPSDEQQKSREDIQLTSVSRPCIESAMMMGYDVIFGVNRENAEELICEVPINMYDSHTYRSIFDIKSNWVAFKNLMKVLKENDVEVIHCNTPVGGMVGRICGKLAKTKKIIYTAHGFHFYNGAPLFNRTILKWAEMIMAHWTDVIITMNEEDYNAALKFKLKKNGKVYKVHGVGIDVTDYSDVNVNTQEIRSQLNLTEDDFLCISAGDLVKRKNYRTAIEAIALTDSNVHYLICGVGPEMDNLREIAIKNGVEKRVHFLGFRKDIKELMAISDCFVFSSFQEGLPRSLMEAMAIGLPCVVSKIRGNIDLINDSQGGYLCETKSPQDFSEAITKLENDSLLRMEMSNFNKKKIREYDVSVVQMEIEKIYNDVL